mmetsp:Transcript_21823/g.58224  ORF Transcript_21823/g.58224 Transcript_21823/m.58224 type:complete len:128 (+) Transcript_21823:352-735(+)
MRSRFSVGTVTFVRRSKNPSESVKPSTGTGKPSINESSWPSANAKSNASTNARAFAGEYAADDAFALVRSEMKSCAAATVAVRVAEKENVSKLSGEVLIVCERRVRKEENSEGFQIKTREKETAVRI